MSFSNYLLVQTFTGTFIWISSQETIEIQFLKTFENLRMQMTGINTYPDALRSSEHIPCTKAKF